VVQRQPVCHTGTAVVAAEEKALQTQQVHHVHHVLRHGALAVGAVVGQALGPQSHQLARQHRADAAVAVARVLHELHLLAAQQRRLAALDELEVQRP